MHQRTHDLGRFESKVLKTDDCWLWKAGLSGKGYGVFAIRGVSYTAHRWYYEQIVGPVSDELQLDHLCRNKACVNPAHLEPVTNQVNTLRSDSPPALNARKTHCKRGHEFTPENTRHRLSRYGHPVRACRECQREADRQRYVKRSA